MAPFRRRSGFALGAPKVVTFALSLILVALAAGSALTRFPHALAPVATHRFWLAVAAWVVLALGVLLPGV